MIKYLFAAILFAMLVIGMTLSTTPTTIATAPSQTPILTPFIYIPPPYNTPPIVFPPQRPTAISVPFSSRRRVPMPQRETLR